MSERGRGGDGQLAGSDFSVLDHVPMGALVVDRALEVLFWNRRLEIWTGIRREQIQGRNLGVFFPDLARMRT